MPRCDDVFSRTLVPKLEMLTFRSYLGRRFDGVSGSIRIHGAICNRQLSVFSCQPYTYCR